MSTAESPVPVAVVRVGGRGEPLELPRYQTAGAAGMDLRADEPVELAPGERRLVPTGVAVAIPPGWEGQVRPRSGLPAQTPLRASPAAAAARAQMRQCPPQAVLAGSDGIRA